MGAGHSAIVASLGGAPQSAAEVATRGGPVPRAALSMPSGTLSTSWRDGLPDSGGQQEYSTAGDNVPPPRLLMEQTGLLIESSEGCRSAVAPTPGGRGCLRCRRRALIGAVGHAHDRPGCSVTPFGTTPAPGSRRRWPPGFLRGAEGPRRFRAHGSTRSCGPPRCASPIGRRASAVPWRTC